MYCFDDVWGLVGDALVMYWSCVCNELEMQYVGDALGIYLCYGGDALAMARRCVGDELKLRLSCSGNLAMFR